VRSQGTRGRHHSASLPTSTHAVLRPKSLATHLRTRNSLRLFAAGVPGERGSQSLQRCWALADRLTALPRVASARRTLTVSQFAGHACRGTSLSPAIRALPPNDTARQARIPVDRRLARGERSRHARAGTGKRRPSVPAGSTQRDPLVRPPSVCIPIAQGVGGPSPSAGNVRGQQATEDGGSVLWLYPISRV
jgi:hypothetical protein